MGRNQAVSKDQFLKAYQKQKSVKEIAKTLELTVASVYLYIRRYGLKIPTKSKERTRNRLADEVFLHYRGMQTIRALSIQYGVKRVTVRRYIERGIELLYHSENPPRWPIPLKLSQIKIVKALMDADKCNDPGYFGETDQIAADTNLPIRTVAEYQEYASEILWKKSRKSAKKKTKGKTKKK